MHGMSATDALEESLTAQSVPCTRTAVDGLDTVLDEVIDPPAVGAPIPVEGVALSERSDVVLDPSPSQLVAARTGVTGASPAIASYGSVVVRSDAEGSEPVSLYPERHVAIVAASDIIKTMREAIDRIGDATREKLSGAVIATGSSATADMGELVYGAHGPTEVHVVVLEDR